MASRARVRRYLPGDERGIAALYRACHGRELPRELWRWRYFDNPFGRATIDVAESGGRIVAHVATIPVALSNGRAEARGGLWADLMVHPQHRNLNQFLNLAETHTRDCRKDGIRRLYAFPNDNSYPLLKRMLGWKTVAEIDALEARLEDLRVPRATPAADYVLEAISAYTIGFDGFWARVRPNAWSIVRGNEWLRWRYVAKPKYNYGRWVLWSRAGMIGWACAKVFGEIGDVLDLWADPKTPAAAMLMDTAAQWFRSRNVRRVSAWALPGTSTQKQYVAWGLKSVGQRTHFAALPFDGEAWAVTKGDSDVF